MKGMHVCCSMQYPMLSEAAGDVVSACLRSDCVVYVWVQPYDAVARLKIVTALRVQEVAVKHVCLHTAYTL